MKFILFLFPLWLLGATIHNGESFIIPFKDRFSASIPYTTCNNIAIVPISYYAKQRTQTLLIDRKKLPLKIAKKTYPFEHLHVASSKVHPPKVLQKRIAHEYKEAQKIYTHTTRECFLNKPFILPINSSITDPFGVARLFNHQLKSFHSGVDFRAKMGTPVKAINDGRVVLAKKRYYAGGSIIIDHGRGIYSCYYHLSRFKVKKGDFVSRGEIIGYSGKSGRVTGPHLHLSIKVKNITVDPLQFINAFNKAYKQKIR